MAAQIREAARLSGDRSFRMVRVAERARKTTEGSSRISGPAGSASGPSFACVNRGCRMKMRNPDSPTQLPFADRTEAGRLLALELGKYRNRKDVEVLALPRGGLPVAHEIAEALNAPMDALLVRKLGVPGQEELAFGAIAAGGVQVLDNFLISELSVTPEDVRRIAEEQRRVLESRNLLYRHGRPAPRVRGKIVIVVDDGIATGS